MSRKIFLEMEIDWEDYEDVSDDFVIIDAFEGFHKDGVEIKISDAIAMRDKLIDELIGALRVVEAHPGKRHNVGKLIDRAEAMRGK